MHINDLSVDLILIPSGIHINKRVNLVDLANLSPSGHEERDIGLNGRINQKSRTETVPAQGIYVSGM